MADISKTIEGLEKTAEHMRSVQNTQREAGKYVSASFKMFETSCMDAIELLKEQQKQIEAFKQVDDALTDRIIDMQDEQPQQKTGHWIPIKSPTGVEAFGTKEMAVYDVRCSVCGAEEDVMFSAFTHCPRCGAKMESQP